MPNYEITPEEMKLTVENPDRLTMQCPIHGFYVKNIPDKGELIVYTLINKETGTHEIQCADWLVQAGAKHE